jgi:hypothetical protein
MEQIKGTPSHATPVRLSRRDDRIAHHLFRNRRGSTIESTKVRIVFQIVTAWLLGRDIMKQLIDVDPRCHSSPASPSPIARVQHGLATRDIPTPQNRLQVHSSLFFPHVST